MKHKETIIKKSNNEYIIGEAYKTITIEQLDELVHRWKKTYRSTDFYKEKVTALDTIMIWARQIVRQETKGEA